MSSTDDTSEDRYLSEPERLQLDAAERRRQETNADDATAVPGRRRRTVATTVRPHVGINWGAAFFGWVAAMGLAVILTAVVAAVGAAIGLTRGSSVQEAASQLSQDVRTVGVTGGVALVVVVFLAYFCGGYVAARMSRFEGVRQGFGVWVWAVVVAVVVAVVAAVAGAKYDVLSSINTFPRLPVDQGSLTTGGIVALVALLIVSLLGAMAGGAAGMRYHRKLEAYDPTLED